MYSHKLIHLEQNACFDFSFLFQEICFYGESDKFLKTNEQTMFLNFG